MMSEPPEYTDSLSSIICFKYFKVKLYNPQNYITKINRDDYINCKSDKYAKQIKQLDDSFDIKLESQYHSICVFKDSDYDALTFDEFVNGRCVLYLEPDVMPDGINVILLDMLNEQMIFCNGNLYHHFDYVVETIDKLEVIAVDIENIKLNLSQVDVRANDHDDEINSLRKRITVLEDQVDHILKLQLSITDEKMNEDENNLVKIDDTLYSILGSKVFPVIGALRYEYYMKKEDIYLHCVEIENSGQVKGLIDKIDNHHIGKILIHPSQYAIEGLHHHDNFYILIECMINIVKSKVPYKYLSHIYISYSDVQPKFYGYHDVVPTNAMLEYYDNAIPYIKEFSEKYKHIKIHIINLPSDGKITTRKWNGTDKRYTCVSYDLSHILKLFTWTDKII